MDPPPEVIALDPHTLGEVLGDIRTLAQATDARTRASRWSRTPRAGSTASASPCAAAEPVRVAALEWLDPVFVAGHWTPQLIEYAGGVDVLGLPGEHSERASWEEVAAARPEVVVVMPCGYDAERALAEAEAYADELAALGRAADRRGRRRRRTSPAPGRGSSTGSSCWPTSSTPTACPSRPRGARLAR